MAKKSKYIILSPDGIPIHPIDTYASQDIAKTKFDGWLKQYEKQGYYGTVRNGERLQIQLHDVESYCTLVEL